MDFTGTVLLWSGGGVGLKPLGGFFVNKDCRLRMLLNSEERY